MTASNIKEWSEIEVAHIQNTSRLTTCKSIQPLRILNPNSHGNTCYAVLSNYGGGVVAGDQIGLRVKCHTGTNFFLGTQSSTKVYKSMDGKVAVQQIDGTLAGNAFAVVFPDPVVMQKDSKYRQIQHWNITNDSLLLVVDWVSSGRIDMGETFLFDSFTSELKVSIHQKIALLDRFSFSPSSHLPSSAANFKTFHTALNAYLIGNPADERFIQIAEKMMAMKETFVLATYEETILRKHSFPQDKLISVTKAKDGMYTLRALGSSRHELQPYAEELMNELATPTLLNYNPFKRKY